MPSPTPSPDRSTERTDTARAGMPAKSEIGSKLLPATFTLLGLSVGFFGVLEAAVSEAGPWREEREALLPFAFLVNGMIVANACLATLAILDLAGYISAKRTLVGLTSAMLMVIALFVLLRSTQMFS